MSAVIDPRRGVPSASAMYRLENCPASWLASKDLPDESNNDADSGTRIHAALEAGDYTGGLSAEESETAERCAEQKAALYADWLGDGEPATEHREVRLGLTTIGGVVVVNDSTATKLLFSGQADCIMLSGVRALVIDYKTGRGEYEHATDNAQLRALAVLVAKRWRLQAVRVAIVQPWAGPPTVADYDADALAAAQGWLTGALLKVNAATPDDLNAGDWCKWCKAKATCPKLRETALAPVERVSMGLALTDDKAARAALFARAMELEPSALAALYRGLDMVGWYVSAIEGAMRKRVEAGEVAGFVMKPGVVREKIADVGLVWQRYEAVGVSAARFTQGCTLTKSEAKDMLREACGLKGKALDAKLDECLAGAVEAKETSATVQEVKP